jgi:radical SAM family uncharacterized protein/radical SAM-linked protein
MFISDQNWFSHISRPSRYLGGEINAVRKDLSKTEVSIVLAFPDVYEVGMSHLGLKILYHILNAQEWVAAERVFCPWVDMEAALRRLKIPLTTLESGRPLRHFDLVGFSLQHELSYTNVLNMLDLSGIPPLTRDRSDRDPLIIAGGPACFNPEPVADFFDLMVVGDGESVALEICRAVREAKQRRGATKQALLHDLRHVTGIYIPSLFQIRYGPEGAIEEIVPVQPDYREVRKAVLPDLDAYPFPERPIVPFTEIVHDRVSIEIARGCTRGCRFCQAGMIYRPVRERRLGSILEKAENALGSTGYEDLSLLSLSSGDYSCIGPLLRLLMDRLSPRHIGVSLPSLRVDSLDTEMMEQIKRVRKTGFTLAPEAGNDRLRRIINKGLTQKDILETSQAVYRAGWNLIKLYFMIGLPYEEEGDLLDIIDLSRQIYRLAGRKGKKANLNVSISPFVPKAHTPFMWTAQVPLKESRRRIRRIQDGLERNPAFGAIRVRWNQPELSWLEGVFSRGDRRLSRVVMEAWGLGARFDAWSEHFKKEAWEEAFARCGLDPGFYLYRERDLKETHPWDHIQSGVTGAFLREEWLRAGQARLTPDCRTQCLECGACDHQAIDPVLHPCPETADDPTLSGAPRAYPQSVKRYRMTYRKLDRARHLSHLELSRVLIRAFRRAGLELAASRGYHPMPKISFFTALPVGTESLEELMQVELLHAVDPSMVKERINAELPAGVEVTFVDEIPSGEKRPRITESRFLITFDRIEGKENHLTAFLQSDHFPIVKTGKTGQHEVDARSLVSDIAMVPPDKIRLTVKEREGPGLKPTEIIKGIFDLEDEDLRNLRVMKTGQTLAQGGAPTGPLIVPRCGITKKGSKEASPCPAN